MRYKGPLDNKYDLFLPDSLLPLMWTENKNILFPLLLLESKQKDNCVRRHAEKNSKSRFENSEILINVFRRI